MILLQKPAVSGFENNVTQFKFAITKDQVKEAIAIIEESRRTHVLWSRFFDLCPEHQETVKDTVHNKEEQDEIIEEYTKVLDVLHGFLLTFSKE